MKRIFQALWLNWAIAVHCLATFCAISSTIRSEVLPKQLVLCTSRQGQDVDRSSVCHSSSESPDLLVLLVRDNSQSEAWKRE